MAALKLFASKGYEATTTREIATCAGCAEGLIHRYFRSKAGLLSALIGHRISKEVADLDAPRPSGPVSQGRIPSVGRLGGGAHVGRS